MYGDFIIFQAFDKEVCHKAVQKAGDGSDQYENRRNDEHRLYFLYEQGVSEEELRKVMEERTYQTQTNRPEKSRKKIKKQSDENNTRNSSAKAQDKSRSEE